MAKPTPSDLDFSQCIQGAYDEPNGRLRVDAAITAPLDVNGEVLVDVRASDGDSVLVYGTTDGTTGGPQQVLKVNADGSINVDFAPLTAVTANQGTPNTIANAWPVELTNGTNIANVNPDGSLNVNVVTSSSKVLYSLFNSISSVSNGVLTTILSYTVPIGKTDFLSLIEVSGTNMAQFDVYINGVLNARKRTSLTEFNEEFDFSVTNEIGLSLSAGTIVLITVLQNRPDLGNYEARLMYAE